MRGSVRSLSIRSAASLYSRPLPRSYVAHNIRFFQRSYTTADKPLENEEELPEDSIQNAIKQVAFSPLACLGIQA